jgi:hypothetical protein
MIRRNRRPDRRRVKALRSYTIDELARTLEVHRNTVRHWIKAGLPVIDDKRPILMLGADLAEFLWRRRDARRQPCRAGQMFCLKCRKPQEPAGRMADFVASSATSGALIGICPACNRLMYRRVSAARLSEVAGALDVHLTGAQPRIGQFATAELICSIERELRSPALTRMPHQILASIGRRPELAAPALSSWFGAPNSRRLARWLIFDSLFEDTSATAKFLAVAQAWEILGRDEVNAAAYDKKQYQTACKAAREALEKHLDASTAQRLYELARASNRKSFGDMVREVISKIPPPAVQALCPDVDGFVTTVVKVRNVLTHMEGKKSLPIETASYLSIFLTCKLIVLFCIYDCAVLGLPLDNLQMTLANNATARAALRPLPKL